MMTFKLAGYTGMFIICLEYVIILARKTNASVVTTVTVLSGNAQAIGPLYC